MICLIARIGDGGWFRVGAGVTFTAASSGELAFTVNEQNQATLPAAFSDNSGTITVEICQS